MSVVRISVFVALFGAATTAAGQEGAPTVPSGLDLSLQEVILENLPDGKIQARYRYLAPDLADAGYDRVAGDFPALCDQYALPELTDQGHDVAHIILSMSDRPVVFGDSDPEAVQFFEAFSITDATCVWEAF